MWHLLYSIQLDAMSSSLLQHSLQPFFPFFLRSCLSLNVIWFTVNNFSHAWREYQISHPIFLSFPEMLFIFSTPWCVSHRSAFRSTSFQHSSMFTSHKKYSELDFTLILPFFWCLYQTISKPNKLLISFSH